MVAEYGGRASTDEGGVKYVHQDIQGTTRAITSVSGAVKARTDYAAFGEEISSSVGQRTAQGYTSSDSLRQKYALTERDEASGLDHTWFRKHENRAGRWTSPDPYNGSMNLGDPQSFNRYSYVANQPTNFVDPSGLNMMNYSCYDLNTYWHQGDVSGVATTTICNYWSSDPSIGSGEIGTEAGGGDTPQEIYDRCKNKAGGSSELPKLAAAYAVLSMAKQEGISATLLAVTWYKESTFSYFGDNIPSNKNDGTAGNVDVGPMQINYNTFAKWKPLYGVGYQGLPIDDENNVFGPDRNGDFSGSINSNLSAGARILKSYGGDDRNRAGLYRSGNGDFLKTKQGKAEYNARAGEYDRLKPIYDIFFSCLASGG
jgi:RHS repeat-associated protein